MHNFVNILKATEPYTLFFNLMFIFEREMECEPGRGRGKKTQNLKQAPGSELSAQSLTLSLNSNQRS